ncbi:MAG: hypothetical protein R2710_15850 [Acidimicrobiales bacterium]
MNFRRFLGLAGLASVIGAVAVRQRSATATEQAVLGNRMRPATFGWPAWACEVGGGMR